MPRREEQIGLRVAEMTLVEIEDWQDTLARVVSRLEDLASEMGEGDLSDLGDVEKQVRELEREQLNLDDPVLDREADILREEVARVLNEAEGARRRREDEDRAHRWRCEDMSRRVKELAGKFKGLEGRR